MALATPIFDHISAISAGETALANPHTPMSPAGWRTVALGRTLVCVLLGATLMLAAQSAALRLPALETMLALASLAAFFALIWRRGMRALARVGAERLAVLLFDVAALAIVLHLSAPRLQSLSALLLLPVAVAAMSLPLRRAMLVILAAACAFASLQVVPVVIVEPASATPGLLSPWLIGATSAAMVALFAFRLSELLRVHRRRLAVLERRQQQGSLTANTTIMPAHDAKDAPSLPIGSSFTTLDFATLAAGTAHEMGTPLSTLTMLLGELRSTAAPPSDWRAAIDVLWQATQSCRRSLHDMAAAVENGRALPTQTTPPQLCEQLVTRLRDIRPTAQIAVVGEGGMNGLMRQGVSIDITVRQGLLNLLDNAVKVSKEQVELRWSVEDRFVVFQVLDRGPGIPAALRQVLGRQRVHHPQAGGHGIGVLLTATAVARAGGTLNFSDRHGGGTVAKVRLPAVVGLDVVEHASTPHDPTDSVRMIKTPVGPFGTTGHSAGLEKRSNFKRIRRSKGLLVRHPATEDVHVPDQSK